MKGFIEVSYYSRLVEYKIKCHYTQVYSNGVYWYWNDKSLIQDSEQIKELIKQAQG